MGCCVCWSRGDPEPQEGRGQVDEAASLPAHDSVGDEGEPDEVECHQNGQDLPD